MENASDESVENLSPKAVEKRFRRTIEVYATKVRLEWNLPHHLEMDLRSYGQVGLFEALERFDASRGFAFRTYAEHRIQGAIKNGVRTLLDAKRVAKKTPEEAPPAQSDKWARLVDHVERIALAVVTIRDYNNAAASADAHENPEHALENHERRELLGHALDALPDREREILRLHYTEDANGVEIGAALGIHRSTVWRLHDQALDSLRESLRALRP